MLAPLNLTAVLVLLSAAPAAAEPPDASQAVESHFRALRKEFRVPDVPALPRGSGLAPQTQTGVPGQLIMIDQQGRARALPAPSLADGAPAPCSGPLVTKECFDYGTRLAGQALARAVAIIYEDRVQIVRTITSALYQPLGVADAGYDLAQEDTPGNRVGVGLSLTPFVGGLLSKAAKPVFRISMMGAGRLTRVRFKSVDEALAHPPRSLDDQLEYGPQLAHLSRESGEHAFFKLVGELEGLPKETIEQIQKLGSQGLEQTCARYAVAACAIASGVNLTPGQAKEISAGIVQESMQARLMSPQKLEQYYGQTQSGLSPDMRIADHLKRMDQPSQEGLSAGQMMETARRGGLSARTLDPGSFVDKSYYSGFWSPDGDRARFLQESAALRDKILEELRQKRAVAISVSHHAESPSNHAVTVLARGQNAQGSRLAVIYDSETGSIDLWPWEHLFPRSAVVMSAK